MVGGAGEDEARAALRITGSPALRVVALAAPPGTLGPTTICPEEVYLRALGTAAERECLRWTEEAAAALLSGGPARAAMLQQAADEAKAANEARRFFCGLFSSAEPSRSEPSSCSCSWNC